MEMRGLMLIRRRIQSRGVLFPRIHPARNIVPLPLLPSSRNAAPFSTTYSLWARKELRQKKDMRITLIRYHLMHPLTPRPLRFSRLRALRHWTIHRAWNLYRAKQRRATELELERQYLSMRDACEALRLIGDNGMSPDEAQEKGGREPKDQGRLYRSAMGKQGIWTGVPIEYARAQTEWPSKEGWNHTWTR